MANRRDRRDDRDVEYTGDLDDTRTSGSTEGRTDDVVVEPTGSDVRYEEGRTSGVDYTETRTEPVGEVREQRTEAVTTSQGGPDAGIGEARRRFGGLDIPATLTGMLVALALTVLLGGLLSAAIGAIGLNTGFAENSQELSVGGAIGWLLTLFISFLIGGWAAARIARYDGAKNGIMTAVWAILLALILGAVGAWLGDQYNITRNIALPGWLSRDALRTGAIITAILSAITMLLGGWLGGLWGQRYHRRADAAIASTREGGIYREREVRRADHR